MTVDLDYKNTLNGIVQDIMRMENVLESDQQEALEKIGKVIKKETQNLLPKSDEAGSGYKHMRDDIKVTINGKRKKTGVTGVTVHGGKLTAYKWHMLDDGTRNPDGSIHTRAIHFTSNAMEKATPQIEKILDELIGRATHD
ncbi:MAG: HK97 gp10 family phage protein [Bacteroidales bacterium]|nr:HK97 gp10 family phage protein [Bacteroidales bacterium]